MHLFTINFFFLLEISGIWKKLPVALDAAESNLTSLYIMTQHKRLDYNRDVGVPFPLRLHKTLIDVTEVSKRSRLLKWICQKGTLSVCLDGSWITTPYSSEPLGKHCSKDGIDLESVATGSTMYFRFNLCKMVHHMVVKIHSSKIGVSNNGLLFKMNQDGRLLNLTAQ